MAEHDANPGFGQNPGFGDHLNGEMRHAMMSISAAAFTFEAFANSVVHQLPSLAPKAGVRPLRFTNWRARGAYLRRAGTRRSPSRAALVRQTLGNAFTFSNALGKGLRVTLKEAFEFRNMAVHSPAGFVDPVMRDEYGIATEVRYARFTASNADVMVKNAYNIFRRALARPKHTNDADWLAW